MIAFFNGFNHNGVEYLPAIFQDNKAFIPTNLVYLNQVLVSNGEGWKNINATMEESDFLILEPGETKDDSGTGTENPDFSTSGSAITFGYMTTNGSPGDFSGINAYTTSGLDNFNVTVNYTPIPLEPPSVSEPTNIIGLGILASFGVRIGFKRKLAKAKKK